MSQKIVEVESEGKKTPLKFSRKRSSVPLNQTPKSNKLIVLLAVDLSELKECL